MAYVQLTNGDQVLVDDADLPLLAEHKWRRLTAAKTYHYAATTTRSPVILLHRFLMQPEPGFVVDHINGNTMDNRRANLRVCTHAENMRNKRTSSNSKNPYKGIYPSKKRWVAVIGSHRNSKRAYLGLFKTPEEAASAYDIAAVLRFGEFACLNFPHVFPEIPFRRAEKNLPEAPCELLRTVAKSGETT